MIVATLVPALALGSDQHGFDIGANAGACKLTNESSLLRPDPTSQPCSSAPDEATSITCWWAAGAKSCPSVWACRIVHAPPLILQLPPRY